MPEIINKDVDLVYSEEDNGYYLQNFKTDKVSQVFSTAREAKKALSGNGVKWEE